MISWIMNWDTVIRTKQLAAIGFPEKAHNYSDSHHLLDGDKVSKHANSKLHQIARSVPNFGAKTGLGDGGIIGVVIVSAFIFTFIALFLSTELSASWALSFFALFFIEWVVLELWSLHNIVLIRQFTKDNQSRVQEEIAVAIAEERADHELHEKVQQLTNTIADAMAAEQFTLSDADLVTPMDDETWSVESVQFHDTGVDPSDRSATITVQNAAGDTRVCAISSSQQVTDWLDKKMRSVARRTVSGTHTHTYLQNLSISEVQSVHGSRPEAIIDYVGKMAATLSRPREERAPVRIWGTRSPEGTILTQGLLLGNELADGAVRTSVQPVIALRRQVDAFLDTQNQHPAVAAG